MDSKDLKVDKHSGWKTAAVLVLDFQRLHFD